MIKRLRRHIILVNMILVGIVIMLIFSVVCVNSYSTANGELERGLNQVIEKNSKSMKNFMDFPKLDETDDVDEGDVDDADDERDDETEPQIIGRPDMRGNHPMQLGSYIFVEVDEDGNILDSYESNVTIDSGDLKKCISAVLESGDRNGQLSDYGLAYCKNTDFDTIRISFADNGSVYATLGNTVVVCVLLFFGSMLVIFLISLWLSRFAVNPVKKAWEQQKQFVADASHELKTPLTVILANNNIMMSHENSTVRDERQWLESTEEEAQHMKKLIDQMLFLAKSDAGMNTVELSEVDFSEIVEGASLNFEPVAFERGVMLDSRIDSSVVLTANKLQLTQLAHILIDNAVKYADENSTVTIRLKKSDSAVEFSVNNVGSVISKDELEHIFDRFYRSEKSRTTKGYGLGLSIAQNITTSMNGKLTAVSNEQDGTTFTASFRP